MHIIIYTHTPQSHTSTPHPQTKQADNHPDIPGLTSQHKPDVKEAAIKGEKLQFSIARFNTYMRLYESIELYSV